MHRLYRYLILGLVLLVSGYAAGVAQADTRLPQGLPKTPGCSTLNKLTGKAYDEHLLWHLAPKGQYKKMHGLIWRESRWHARAKNPSSTASGYAQFLAFWWDGSVKWHWNPFNGHLHIRFFVWVVRTCGYSPWGC